MAFSLPLPTDPAIDLSSPLGALVLRLQAQAAEGRIQLPPINNLRPLLFIRWLFRNWLTIGDMEGGG